MMKLKSDASTRFVILFLVMFFCIPNISHALTNTWIVGDSGMGTIILASEENKKEKPDADVNTRKCKSLDIREYGVVGDGSIGEPWSEAQLIEKYGPPCQIIDLGEVYIERSKERIIDLGPKTLERERVKTGTVAIKKQFIYSGDYSNKTSIFTIIDGVVVKKERIYE